MSSEPKDKKEPQEDVWSQPVGHASVSAFRKPHKTDGDFVYESNALAVFFNQFSKIGLNFTTILFLYLIIIGVVIGLTTLGVGLGFGIFFGLRNMPEIGVFALIPLIIIFVVLLVIVSGFFTAAAGGYAIATVRGQQFTLSDAINLAKKRGFGLIGVNIIYGLAVFGGLLLFIVPGVLFAYWFAYAQYLYIDDHSLSVGDSLSKSRDITQGKFWELSGLFGVNLIIGALAQIPFLGIVVSFLGNWLFMLSYAYRYTSDRYIFETQTLKPPTHWANYLITFLAPVILLIFFGFAVILGIISETSQY